MPSTHVPPGRLQKSMPAPPAGAAEAPLDQSLHRKPLPNSNQPRSLPPALAADHGIFLPPPPVGGAEPSKRHSSYDWTPNRPSTSGSSHPSTAGSSIGRPSTPDTSRTTARLRPSASAVNLAPSQPPPVTIQKPQPKDERKKKGGWFSSKKDKKEDMKSPGAWTIAPGRTERVPFDVDGLEAGRPASDLWDPQGNCLIHLFPQSSGKGASFRIDSTVFASSAKLTERAFGKLYSEATTDDVTNSPARRRDVSGAHSTSSNGGYSGRASLDSQHGEVHLYLDTKLNGAPAPKPPKKSMSTPLSDDAETLIGARNLFAFLCGQSLVATERRFTLYSIFQRIADLLQQYDFTNMDGSSFGEVAIASFDNYVNELGLADVRKSTQKTVEMIVLGERMRSVSLYNEAFTHAAGKHKEILSASTGPFKLVSQTTQTRLSRAAMDLDKRVETAGRMLIDFDFPAIFSGIMNSRTADERRLVNFDAWKTSFFKMRSFFISYYKGLFGSWPPKPNPKKNTLQTPGLNRVVLLTLYNDLGAMYDLLVDRMNLTNRTADGVLIDERAADPPRVRALRHILSEYDRSTPPVKPPVPFDLPLIPSLHTTRPELGKDKKVDAKLLNKNLKSEEVATILAATYNRDAAHSPFLAAYTDFERSQARGNNITEIADQRDGYWIFMYAVLQALPLLVIDAPGIKYTDGVEYFLCEASRGGVPWARSGADPSRAQTWYGIAGGAGVVSLPSDVIENSIEGVYRRSHAWVMAERWSRDDPLLNAAVHEQQAATTTGSATGSAGHPSLSGLPPPDLAAPGFRAAGRSGSASVLGSDVSTPLAPPPVIPSARAELRVDSRSSSPARSKRESVLGFGLEALPMRRGGGAMGMPDGSDYFAGLGGPPPVLGGGVGVGSGPGTPVGSRPVSVHVTDPNKTFDAILGDVGMGKEKGKKKR